MQGAGKKLVIVSHSNFHIDHLSRSLEGSLFIIATHRDMLCVARRIGDIETKICSLIFFSCH